MRLLTSTKYTSPRHYEESLTQQAERLAAEISAEKEEYTLKIVKQVVRWLQTQRLLEREYDESDCFAMARGQLRVEGVTSEHLDAAAALVVDIYLGR